MGKRSPTASVFDAVSALDAQDRVAEANRRKRRKSDERQSKAAGDQLQLHRRLVECRILLQRSVTGPKNSSVTTEQCNELLGLLLEARRKLQCADDDNADKSDGANTNDGGALKAYLSKVSALDADEVLQEEYESARDNWKRVLDRRHSDLKLHSGGLTRQGKKLDTKFSVMDATFWQQVESTVEYEALRRQQQKQQQKEDALHAFDDSKVYQHMLQEFVSSGNSAAAPASVAAARKLGKGGKQKKQVDRRASKGRKIRYKEIPKLVSFAFPLSKAVPPSSTVMEDDAWFASLFGGVGKST